MREPLVVQARYRGPARSANGGYTGGALAHALGDSIGRPVTVQLSQPPPLDASMHLDEHDGGLVLSFGGAEVATARYADGVVEPVEGVSWAQASAASASYPGFRSHPFPTCFACGTDRPDGLRIFPGEVPSAHEGRTRVAAPWTPDRTLSADWHEYHDPSRRVGLAATWAALDCVGGWAGDLSDRLMVLGRMTAVIDDLPVVGEPHVVVGEARGAEGRRTFTAATLQDADGRIVGRAQHVWVTVDPARFNG